MGKIVFLLNRVNLNDISHAESIASYLNEEGWESNYIDANQEIEITHIQLVKIFNNDDSEDDRHLILAVGENGLEKLIKLNLDNLRESLKNIKIGASLHKFFEILTDLNLDFLALPKAIVYTSLEVRIAIDKIPTTLLTLGPPMRHFSNLELKAKYEKWPNAHSRYNNPSIITMLPGDVPNKDGKIEFFTETNANSLFSKMIKLWKDKGQIHRIIIQNNPRTGKFNVDGSPNDSHKIKTGENPNTAIDMLSQFFIRLLEAQKKLTPNLDYEFHNYAIEENSDKSIIHSVYHELLYVATLNPNNIFIIPGESVSMLNEVPRYLNPLNSIVFKSSPMSFQDHANLKFILQKGHCCYFDLNNAVVTPAIPLQLNQDDANKIATSLTTIHNVRSRHTLT